MKQISGATVDGKKPLPKATVEGFGHRGAARESAPKASQVANLNGKTLTTGQHVGKPVEAKPNAAAAGKRANELTTNTFTDAKKRLAASMYPSSTGPR